MTAQNFIFNNIRTGTLTVYEAFFFFFYVVRLQHLKDPVSGLPGFAEKDPEKDTVSGLFGFSEKDPVLRLPGFIKKEPERDPV